MKLNEEVAAALSNILMNY